MLDKCYSESWKKAYDIIKLENDLINHRMTSLLAVHAFLLTGIFLILTKGTCYAQLKDAPWYLIVFYYIALFIGLSTSVIAAKGIRAALRQIVASSVWLKCVTNEIGSEHKDKYPYPPIVGRKSAFWFFNIKIGNEDDYGDEHLPPIGTTDISKLSTGITLVPQILICAWIVLFFVPVLC